jgi:hypothetical protein
MTSNSKNLQTLKQHLDYISRNGTVELLSADELIYSGMKDIGEVRDIFRDEGAPIPTKTKVGQREYRETYNMVFSFKDIDGETLKKAAHKTISEKYPNNYFVLAFHGDTDHSHCHICLKVKNSSGKRLDIGLQGIYEIRKDFAKNLRDLGVLATAARKPKPVLSYREKLDKQHFYEITGWGHAPYQNIEGNKLTGYVKYLTTKGEEITLYGDDILRAVKTSGVKIGGKARLRVARKEEVIVKLKEKGKKTGEGMIWQKKVHKNVWECITIEQAKLKEQQQPKKADEIKKDNTTIINTNKEEVKQEIKEKNRSADEKQLSK